jgi:hypothetical protein
MPCLLRNNIIRPYPHQRLDAAKASFDPFHVLSGFGKFLSGLARFIQSRPPHMLSDTSLKTFRSRPTFFVEFLICSFLY